MMTGSECTRVSRQSAMAKHSAITAVVRMP